MTPPQINIPLTRGDKMTLETYAMLKAICDELTAVQAAIANLEARVTALEP